MTSNLAYFMVITARGRTYGVERFCTKEKKVAAYLLAEVSKLRGIGRKLDKGSCRLCLGKETFKHICRSIHK